MGESVDEFTQDLEKLFDRSYGHNAGMDKGSKDMLKQDFFVQSLLLKQQEKVLPSAKTFTDALHQAQVTEQQEKQLSKLHQPGGGTRPSAGSRLLASSRNSSTQLSQPREIPESSASSRSQPPGGCYERGSYSHCWRDCPKLKLVERDPQEGSQLQD